MSSSPSAASRWSRPDAAVVVAAVCSVAVVGVWGLLHVGFYRHHQIKDTPVYQKYGDSMADGRVPYRDFAEIGPRLGKANLVLGRWPEVERILSGEQTLSERLVDDDHALGAGTIGVGEITSREDRNTQRREEAG